jgi:hypothetical protein
VRSADGAYTIGVSKVSDSIIAIEAVEIIDPSSISDNTNRPSNLPFGLFSYRITVNEIGATATVRIYFSRPISSSTTFYKYDTINGWQDYSQHTTFNGDGRSIDLELKDGGYGDIDGEANGVIVDPGGLAEATTDDDDKWYGCFITTAAWDLDSHVELSAILTRCNFIFHAAFLPAAAIRYLLVTAITASTILTCLLFAVLVLVQSSRMGGRSV